MVRRLKPDLASNMSLTDGMQHAICHTGRALIDRKVIAGNFAVTSDEKEKRERKRKKKRGGGGGRKKKGSFGSVIIITLSELGRIRAKAVTLTIREIITHMARMKMHNIY